jgi:hypothetical protein
LFRCEAHGVLLRVKWVKKYNDRQWVGTARNLAVYAI